MFRNDLHQLRVFIVFDIMSAFITLRELLCYSTSLAPVAPVWPKSRTRKSFTKPLVSVLFPLKKQGWGLRGLSQPPTLQDSRATHGISMTVMVCCRVTGFSLSAAFPSCPTPFLEGQGVSKSLSVCWHPCGTRVQWRGAAAAPRSAVQDRQEMPCKEE